MSKLHGYRTTTIEFIEKNIVFVLNFNLFKIKAYLMWTKHDFKILRFNY